MQFLYPIWFLAIAAVIAPVLIHLWNTRKSRPLQVGSIAFIDEASEKKSWQKRITDPLLLLVRVLLISALAFLFAKPILIRNVASSKSRGWVLLGRENLPEIYHQYGPVIDSLIKAGYETRYFDADFPLLNLEQALKDRGRKVSQVSNWAIASSLERVKPKNLPGYIFTNDEMKNFYGERFAASNWFLYSSNSFDSAGETKPDTTTVEISIAADPGSVDGNYLKAALEAISKYGQKRMSIKLTNDLSRTPPAKDWIFWLSQKPIHSNLQAKNSFQYDTGKIVNRSSVIISNDQMIPAIKLYQVIGSSVANPADHVLLQDGFGNPILVRNLVGNKNEYYFASRFDPAFNDLPWHAAFPQFIYRLMYDSSTQLVDRRTIDPKQLKPNMSAANEAGIVPGNLNQSIDLSAYFWLFVFALFGLERFLSYFKQKNEQHAG